MQCTQKDKRKDKRVLDCSKRSSCVPVWNIFRCGQHVTAMDNGNERHELRENLQTEAAWNSIVRVLRKNCNEYVLTICFHDLWNFW